MSDPKIAQKAPYVKDMEPGTYAWCSCGLSENQPLCDGAHRGTGFKPEIIKVETKQKIAWCGCKKTGRVPFCDGAHKNLPDG